MFNIKIKTTKPTQLEEELERLLAVLADKDPADDDYAAVADQVVKLYKLKEIDSKRRVSPDVLANAVTSIVGILIVTNYEHAHVLTSKALGLVMRSR